MSDVKVSPHFDLECELYQFLQDHPEINQSKVSRAIGASDGFLSVFMAGGPISKKRIDAVIEQLQPYGYGNQPAPSNSVVAFLKSRPHFAVRRIEEAAGLPIGRLGTVLRSKTSTLTADEKAKLTPVLQRYGYVHIRSFRGKQAEKAVVGKLSSRSTAKGTDTRAAH
jgi:hypothetical protein